VFITVIPMRTAGKCSWFSRSLGLRACLNDRHPDGMAWMRQATSCTKCPNSSGGQHACRAAGLASRGRHGVSKKAYVCVQSAAPRNPISNRRNPPFTVAWQLLRQQPSQPAKGGRTTRLEEMRDQTQIQRSYFMQRNTEQRKQYDEPFKHAAVEFFQKSGKTLDEVAEELGISAADLRHWKKKYSPPQSQKTGKGLSNVAQLKAENEALRNEVLHLKVQWDILKTTLGILSTTICSRENYV
jgi:transposase-like protein